MDFRQFFSTFAGKKQAMNRVFHQRFTPSIIITIGVLCLLTFYLFWTKTVLAAVFTSILLVIAVERAIHTQYTIIGNDALVVERGRFAKQQTIGISEIENIETINVPIRLAHYVLITYAHGKSIALTPEREDDFIREIRKRLK